MLLLLNSITSHTHVNTKYNCDAITRITVNPSRPHHVLVCLEINSGAVILQREYRAPCGQPRPSQPIKPRRGISGRGHCFMLSNHGGSIQQDLPDHALARVFLRVNYHWWGE